MANPFAAPMEPNDCEEEIMECIQCNYNSEDECLSDLVKLQGEGSPAQAYLNMLMGHEDEHNKAATLALNLLALIMILLPFYFN